MNAATGAKAWSLFWEEQGAEGGCLVTDDLQRPLLSQWLSFAGQLAGGANVIDLGCGAATVGRVLLGYRGDLRIVGIDSALVPTQSRPGLESISSIRMEALPFEKWSFDAAVSQFAVEYGNIRDTAQELHRVLKPGGHFCFLAHHSDSQIARDGRMRRNALRALVSGPVRSSFLSGKPDRLRCEIDRLLRMYPREQTIRLARDYFSRRISSGAAERQQVALAAAELISPEISMLSQLDRSALSAEHLGKWLVPLLAGMLEVAVSVVRSPSGDPIAWKICGRR